MKTDWNSQAFTPEEVKQGLFTDLLTYLTTFNQKSKESYYDIRIYSDGYCQCIDWIEHHYDEGYQEGNFEYVPFDAEVMEEYFFPDNHCELFSYRNYEEETKEALSEWLKNNPGWERNSWGNWYNIEENKKLKEELLGKEGEDENGSR